MAFTIPKLNIPTINAVRNKPQQTNDSFAEGLTLTQKANFIGQGFREVGTEIGQSIVRSFLTTGQVISDRNIRAEFKPEGSVQQKISGSEEAFGFQSIGTEILDIFGLGTESNAKFALPLGIFLAGLDIVPIPGKRNALKKLADNLAKKTSPDDIFKLIKPTVKGTEADVQGLARGIAKMDNSIQIEKLLSVVTSKRLPITIKKSDIGIPPALRSGARDSRQQLSRLRDNFRTQERAARIGAVERAKAIKIVQRDVVDLISKRLPATERGKFLRVVRDTTSIKDLDEAIERISTAVRKVEEAKVLSRRTGDLRSKIAFIRKVGEFNRTVIQEVKREVGVTTSLKKASEADLGLVVDALKKRLSFKTSRGFRPTFKQPKELTDRSFDDNTYEQVLATVSQNKSKISQAAKQSTNKLKEVGSGAKKLLESIGGTISTRLGNIDPSLKKAMRTFEFNLATNTARDMKQVKPVSQALNKLSPEDSQLIKFAVFNGDRDRALQIAKTNGFEKEVKETFSFLETIHKRAKDNNLPIGYLDNYFPRLVTDPRGLVDFINQDKQLKGILDKAIASRETDLGRILNIDERAQIVNSLLRGFRPENISLSLRGSLKERQLSEITPEMLQFYGSPSQSLTAYVLNINEAIETRKFFGKHIDFRKNPEAELKDTIGSFTDVLLREGKIGVDDELALREILQARFGQAKTSNFVGAMKNLIYIDTLTTGLSTITQLGDLYASLYRAGITTTFGAMTRAAFGKTRITPQELGVARIAIETEGSGKAVDTLFKLTGFTAIDMFGKRTLIEATLSWAQRESRKAKPSRRFNATMKQVFGDDKDQIASVLEDFRTGAITEDTKYWAFNNILDFQPVALSEMPEKYLTAGNGRIFYALKTWSIRTLDVYRREVFEQAKTDKQLALTNLFRLTVFLGATGATADFIKDYVTGRDVKIENVPDEFVEAIAKTFFFNRYVRRKAGEEGLGAAILGQLLPPTQAIDNIYRDAKTIADPDKSIEINELRTIRDIPVAGELYYWWFGRGLDIKERETPPARGRGNVNVKIPSINVPTISIPSISI